MKIQYEILSIGLKQSMVDISRQYANKEPIACREETYDGIFYYFFSKFFVDNKYNLKDIMVQISTVNEDSEQKIKEELFLLLSFFILTFEYRILTIKTIIYNNRQNFYELIDQFNATIDEEDSGNEDIINLLEALKQKLEGLELQPGTSRNNSPSRVKSPEKVKELMRGLKL